MPISMAIQMAVSNLAAFKLNDPVTLTENGQTHDMYVSRTIRRSDGNFGSLESCHITVTYGVGRWSTEVRAELLADGRQKIERRQPADN